MTISQYVDKLDLMQSASREEQIAFGNILAALSIEDRKSIRDIADERDLGYPNILSFDYATQKWF